MIAFTYKERKAAHEKSRQWSSNIWKIIICTDLDPPDHRFVHRFRKCVWEWDLAEYVPFLAHPYIQNFGTFISSSAVSILQNLALIFAVGIPIGLARKDKGYAALTGLVTFRDLHQCHAPVLKISGNLVPAEDMQLAGQAMS